MSELDDGPIMAGAATAFRFPAVAHVGGAARHDQVVTMSKEHVAARDHECAVFDGCEIDVAAGTFEPFPLRRDDAVNAQPRDAAVREDLEPQVCDPFVVLDGKRVL